MRSRWNVGLRLLTLPVVFLPALICLGWQEGGKDLLTKEVPAAARYVLFGKTS